MKHVLIVSSGRTGSTLLMGILNVITGWHIKGENNNFPWGLFLAYQAFEDNPKGKVHLPTNRRFGFYSDSKQKFLNSLSGMLTATLKVKHRKQNLRCTGFKESGYFDIFRSDHSGVKLREYLDFLRKTLDPCHLILLSRNPSEVCQSGYFAKDRDPRLLERLEEFGLFLDVYAKDNPEIAFRLRYDDMVNQSENFKRLFDFLGEKPDAIELLSVLATPHGDTFRSIFPRAINPGEKLRENNVDLLNADRLDMLGDRNAARPYYANVVRSYDEGELQRLPARCIQRSGLKRYVFRCSDNHKIAYLLNGKCACTTISNTIYELKTGEKWRSSEDELHNYFAERQIVIRDVDTIRDHYRFTVVRDPVQRFLSGYRNRIMHHQDLKWLISITQNIDHVPSVDDFAFELEDYCKRSWAVENHFLPQTIRIGDDLSVFSDVFPIEKMTDLEKKLSNHVNYPVRFDRFQTGGPDIGLQDISEKALEKLIEFYADDYDVLSEWYSPDKIRRLYRSL